MKTLMLFLAILLGWAVPTFAQNADEIIKKAHLAAYYAGDDGGAQMLMKVYSGGGAKPTSKLFYMLRLDLEEGGKQRFFIYFSRPTDIRRTTFLVHKFIDRDDLRRLYIPASDKVLAIAGSRKQDPFMGSDFSYEDVSGRHYSKDNHTLLGKGKLHGRKVFLIESVPKVKESKIAKMKGWIDQKNYLPLKVEFYGHDGKVFKIYASSKITTIQGFPTIMKRTMTSPQDGTRTVILLNPKRVKYNLGLGKNLFSERSLKNPPFKYMK